MSRHSSSVSARPLVLRPSVSRLLLAWWVCLHVLLTAAIVAAELTMPLTVLFLGGVSVHAWVRRPRPAPGLVLHTDGTLSLAPDPAVRLRMMAGSALTTWWIALVLRSDAGVRHTVVLLRDQLETNDWRLLGLRLREAGRGG
jgi:Membrane-bound toxin component of toxin-antitoxin system